MLHRAKFIKVSSVGSSVLLQLGCTTFLNMCKPGSSSWKLPGFSCPAALWTLSFGFLGEFYCTSMTEAWIDVLKCNWTKGYDLMLTDWVGKPSKACLFRFFLASMQHSFLQGMGQDPLVKWQCYDLFSDKAAQRIYEQLQGTKAGED